MDGRTGRDDVPWVRDIQGQQTGHWWTWKGKKNGAGKIYITKYYYQKSSQWA
uniref:Uncharacterized protein n=1 Tax=Octopus bimaculoides TaxID=37653 RepID=A0A0L8FVN5_OCTBM